MLSRSTVPTPKTALSLQQALELANGYLESAYKTEHQNVALVNGHDAEIALSQAKKINKAFPDHLKDVGYQSLCHGVASAYMDLGKLLEYLEYQEQAQTMYTKAEKWGGNAHTPGRLSQSPPKCIAQLLTTPGSSQATGSRTTFDNQHQKVATVPGHIFPNNVQPSAIAFTLPEPDERIDNTLQLACCLSLLQASRSHDHTFEPDAQTWIRNIETDTEEKERLCAMPTEVIKVFKRTEIKDAKVVAEVVCLAPVLNKDEFRDLLRQLYTGIDQSGLMDFHQLEGLAKLIHNADQSHLDADDLVKILELLGGRLRHTHQSVHHMRQLTMAVSHVLDAMADTNVTDLDRERLHEPLSACLGELMKNSDPFLVYQASYAYQALLCIPDDESLWKATLRRTGRVIKGISGLVTAVKNVDLVRFMDGLEEIQKGFAGVSKAIGLAHEAYKDAMALTKRGESLLDSLKEGFIIKRKKA
ncbi:hypothetical protein BGX31_010222 [Mortierella sp. GBA43]|nr:hypothetical protein BGX31_010222 [Mortierella sp. GBA43]